MDPNQLAINKNHRKPQGNYEMREMGSGPSVELWEFSSEAEACCFVQCFYEKLGFLLP